MTLRTFWTEERERAAHRKLREWKKRRDAKELDARRLDPDTGQPLSGLVDLDGAEEEVADASDD